MGWGFLGGNFDQLYIQVTHPCDGIVKGDCWSCIHHPPPNDTPRFKRGSHTHTHTHLFCVFLKCISCVIVLKKTRSVTELITDSKIFGYMHRAYHTMSAAMLCQYGWGSKCVPKPCQFCRDFTSVTQYVNMHISTFHYLGADSSRWKSECRCGHGNLKPCIIDNLRSNFDLPHLFYIM